MIRQPKLTLVGAGPGDPELITLKGLRALKDADVVLYDALVNEELLTSTKTDCFSIFVGKRRGMQPYTQDQINQLIVDYAYQYGHVVRLKGGDPFIFGRGMEEIVFAQKNNIETNSVLGVSSINLSGYYGFPLTNRGINESFWVITATTQLGSLSKELYWVSQTSAIAVLLMGLHKLEEIVQLYLNVNKSNTPVFILSKGGTKDANIVKGRMSSIVEQKNLEVVEPPAIIFVGDALEHYMDNPLLEKQLKEYTYA